MIILYTDGGCWPNPGGRWGYGWALYEGENLVRTGSGSGEDGTNNVAELNAAIAGLRETPAGSALTLVSDSQYVTKGLNEWRHNWKTYGWRNIKNRELWMTLSDLVDERDVKVTWVRGHDGCEANELCDRLASAAYRGTP